MDIPGIRNITVSGRIGAGATSLAKGINAVLGWQFSEGGAVTAKFYKEIGADEVDVALRPDSSDLAYEAQVKKLLESENHHIVQAHLAGFVAQGIPGVFKIVVLCEDKDGNDKTEVRIDRLVNRKGITIAEAKRDVREREQGNLEKWRRLYVHNDPHWVYWDRKYYDLVVNTYTMNQSESVSYVLTALGITK